MTVLVGGRGRDTLDGGPGINTLSGGPGRDVFLFDTGLGPGNLDVITDFTPGVDSIHLAHARFQGLAKGALPADESSSARRRMMRMTALSMTP
jgi:Ca2+-binding RTX toxin-like protein